MERAGHGPELIAQNVALLRSLAQGGPMCVGGLMGCRGDAYTGEGALPRQEARAFHRWQAEAFRRAGADFLLAGILPTAPEAQGMAQAMAETGLPYVLSLTLRRDGRLVDGTRLCDLIRETDALLGQGRPAFYMSNCIHPDAVRAALDQAFNRCGAVQARFLGVQANPSPRSFAELDGAEALQGDAPEPWAEAMLRLQGTMDKACEQYLDAARKFAAEYRHEDLIYTITAGLNSCVGYVMTNCLVMESLWKHSSPIHAGEFFHGACEAVDNTTTVLVLMGMGKTRSLEERVVKFLLRKTKKLIVLDANALDMSEYPAYLWEIASTLVLNRLCALYIDEMSYVMGHPVSSRRYMGVEKY